MTNLSYEKHLHEKGIGRDTLLTIFIAFQNRLAGWVKGNGRGPDQNSNIRYDLPPPLPSLPETQFKLHQASHIHSTFKIKICILQEICLGFSIALILIKIMGMQRLYVLVLKYFQWQCAIQIKKSIQIHNMSVTIDFLPSPK